MNARSLFLIAALVSTAAACGSDDVSFTDGGNSGSPDGSLATCGAPFGSCTAIGASMCDDYAGPIPPVQARDNCTSAGGTWADTPCTTTGTVGGCRFEQPTGGGGRWCVTTWWFPPETTSDVMNACPAPAMFVPP